MIQVCIDGASKFGLIGLIIKFEYLSVILLRGPISPFRVIVLLSFAVDHLYLIVKQSHRLYLFFQLEFDIVVLQVFGFCELGQKDIDSVGVFIEFEDFLITVEFRFGEVSLVLNNAIGAIECFIRMLNGDFPANSNFLGGDHGSCFVILVIFGTCDGGHDLFDIDQTFALFASYSEKDRSMLFRQHTGATVIDTQMGQRQRSLTLFFSEGVS